MLDPVMGSAIIGMAARIVGCGYIGIDDDPCHFATAERRMAGLLESVTSSQPSLFGEAA